MYKKDLFFFDHDAMPHRANDDITANILTRLYRVTRFICSMFETCKVSSMHVWKKIF